MKKTDVDKIDLDKPIKAYMAKPDKTLGEHYEDFLRQAEILWNLGYISSEHMYDLLKECGCHHDDGKVNLPFQMRVNDKSGKIKFDEEKEVSHNVLSVFYLNPKDYPKEDYLKIACAILHHHNYCDIAQVLKEKMDLIQELLIDRYTYKVKPSVWNKILGKVLLDPETITLKGLLHRCDYSASGNYQVEYQNDFLLDSLEGMMAVWKQKNPESKWNELQKFCMENREENIIALAPTGMGKTEAGLQWIGDWKGFFILPIRTAINSIYDRVRKDILHDEKLNERLGLLHSESLEYYKNNTQETDLLDYYDRGKKLSLPLNISTIDQLFDFVFKYKGYEMKLTTLAYSKLVIDEIQMYGPDLLAYLVCGIRLIHKQGGKIAIITATLPPFVRDFLVHDAEIPFKEKSFSSDKIRHSVLVKHASINADDILGKYYQNQSEGKGNKILVVCNTIRKAQELFDALKEKDVHLNLHLFHSRFTNSDKAKLEQEIKDFGVTYSKDAVGQLDIQDGIWISTSLVEVSLDIDFDYLFTELLDLNSLLQRMGRLNRKGEKEIEGYNCFVYYDGANIKCGRKGFIDKTLYQCSVNALAEVDGLLSEADKKRLIDTYFTMDRVKDSEFVREYKRIFEVFKDLEVGHFDENDMISLRNIATQNIIPKKVYDENYDEIVSKEKQLIEVGKEIKRLSIAGEKGKEYQELYRKRLDIQEYLKGFIISIPLYEFRIYDKKFWEDFGNVSISRNEKVPIMKCHYDEKGFYPIDYENMEFKDEIMNV